MKRITIKNKGIKLGIVSYDEKKYTSKTMKLYDRDICVTYRDLENYYDAIYYIPYPNETIRGIVMSYEEDSNKIESLIKKIKHKNNIEELTPFKKIKLYGIPSNHLNRFGLTDDLSQTNSIEFIKDIHQFISDNRHLIKRTDKNGFDVDIINDEIEDLNKIYRNFLEANDKNVRNYLYPHLRDGYINLIDRFYELTGANFLSRRRVYPLL